MLLPTARHTLPIIMLALALGFPPPLSAQNQSPAQSSPAAPLRAPFQLTPQQQADVDRILVLWENESNKIKTFTCSFERWEYNSAFGPGNEIPLTKSDGELKYSKPDRGLFRITKINTYDAATGTWMPQQGEPNEHWVCDGKAVYEFDAVRKQVHVYELPPELRGKGIADGPLPFLFGADAAKLSERYFIRQVAHNNEAEIRLEAWPRWPADAADYQRIEILLNRKKFLPTALKVYLPNHDEKRNNSTAYMFDTPKVNDPIDRLAVVFQKPRTPWGWKRVVEQPPVAHDRHATRPAPAAGQNRVVPPSLQR